MPEDKPHPEYSAYVFAWLVWYFAVTIPVVFFLTLLYMVNMFVEVIPAYGAYYALAAVLTVLQVALLSIALRGLYRRNKAKPAWEPWPILTLARKMQGLVALLESD